MPRALFLAVVIAACGWGAFLALYGFVAVHIFSKHVTPFFGPDRERLIVEIIVVTAVAFLGSTVLPIELSRKGRNGTAIAVVGCGLAALLLMGVLAFFWRMWDYPYCWVC